MKEKGEGQQEKPEKEVGTSREATWKQAVATERFSSASVQGSRISRRKKEAGSEVSIGMDSIRPVS